MIEQKFSDDYMFMVLDVLASKKNSFFFFEIASYLWPDDFQRYDDKNRQFVICWLLKHFKLEEDKDSSFNWNKHFVMYKNQKIYIELDVIGVDLADEIQYFYNRNNNESGY